MQSALLPTNSTLWERSIADGMDVSGALGAAIDRIRTAKLVNPDPSFVPFLIYEYGLGELTPYVPNVFDLLRDGIRWQRLRGTHTAVAMALGWLDHTAELREADAARNFWNSFQLYLDALPAADAPDLERIENVVSLSVPKRSKFRRAVHGYDVPALIADRSRLDGSILDTDSGVTLRDDPMAPRWSFGRSFSFDHVLTEAEGTGLGIWIEPAEGEGLTWEAMTLPWEAATFPWSSDAAAARRMALASAFDNKPAWIAFLDADDQVIGYRRCKAARAVMLDPRGAYRHNGQRLAPVLGGDRVYFEALTGFGDGQGQEIASIALALNGDPVRPGRLWLGPDELSGATLIAAKPIALTLRATTRDRFKLVLRF